MMFSFAVWCLWHFIVNVSGGIVDTDHTVIVSIEDVLVHTTPDFYVSYTLDIANFYEPTPVNLSSPQLQYLAKQLSPAILRIGGTEADYTYYFDTENGECSAVPDGYYCFTKTDLEMLMDFASSTNTSVLFGLSAGYPEYPKKNKPTWNSSNTRTFLEYIVENGYGDRFYGFELGNELNGDGDHPSWQIAAIQQLKVLLNEIYGKKKLKVPIIAGPDTHSYTLRKPSIEWITDFIEMACDIVDVFTYHSYVCQNASELLTVNGISEQYKESKRFGDAVDTYCANGSQLVFAGEIAEHNNGGLDGVTNVYEGMIWYLDAMGSVALLGQDAFIRQQIWGLEYHPLYSLLNGLDYDPLPDYWIAVLFNKLMGRGVIKQPSTNTTVRTYFHCYDKNGKADGSVTMAFVNISPTSVSLSFNSKTFGEQHMDYILTPKDGTLQSKDILLNGEMLSIANGELPELNGKESVENPIIVPQYSVGFVHFVGSTIPSCLAMENK